MAHVSQNRTFDLGRATIRAGYACLGLLLLLVVLDASIPKWAVPDKAWEALMFIAPFLLGGGTGAALIQGARHVKPGQPYAPETPP